MSNHFIIIGTPKSGSSSLYKYLADHPESHLSKIKEYNFFMNMGYDWRRQNKTIRIKKKIAFFLGYHIKPIGNLITKHYYKSCYKKTGKLSGDGSICYFYFPEVPKRIKHFVPDSKLLLLLRNPIDRLYSNYWMNAKQASVRTDWYWPFQSFEDYLDQKAHIKEINHYSVSLKRWLQYFTLDDIYIITSEGFFNDTQNSLFKIESFLNISHHHYSKQHWIAPHAKKGNDYPDMHPETRKRLRAYFKPYVDELKSLSQMDYGWDEFNYDL